MSTKINILCQNFSRFDRFDGAFLTIVGSHENRFWAFSKLFWSCLGSVYTLFLDFKGLLLAVYSALKVNK